MSYWSGRRALIFGDSLAEGLAPILSKYITAEGGYVLPPITRVGWSTTGYNHADDWDTNGADVIVVSLGTNDASKTYADYALTLGTMVQRLRANGADVVWIGPPAVWKSDIAQKVSQNSDWQGAVLPSMGVRWIDSRPLARPNTSGGVHFTAAGYQAWANAMWPQLGGTMSVASIFNGFQLNSPGGIALMIGLAVLGVVMLRDRQPEPQQPQLPPASS